MSDVVIRVDKLSKKYRLGQIGVDAKTQEEQRSHAEAQRSQRRETADVAGICQISRTRFGANARNVASREAEEGECFCELFRRTTFRVVATCSGKAAAPGTSGPGSSPRSLRLCVRFLCLRGCPDMFLLCDSATLREMSGS